MRELGQRVTGLPGCQQRVPLASLVPEGADRVPPARADCSYYLVIASASALASTRRLAFCSRPSTSKSKTTSSAALKSLMCE